MHHCLQCIIMSLQLHAHVHTLCVCKKLYVHAQGCTSTLDISHRLIEFAKCPSDFSVQRTNVLLSYLFSNMLFAPYPIGGHSHLFFFFSFFFFVASFTLHWPQSGTGSWMAPGVARASLEKLSFRVVAKNIADCNLSGPVLNLLYMDQNQNISLPLLPKHAFEQYLMPPIKILKVGRHTADVERGLVHRL